MTDHTARPPSAFRLNLEQQRKRAKDLLRAAKADDARALDRFAAVHDELLRRRHDLDAARERPDLSRLEATRKRSDFSRLEAARKPTEFLRLADAQLVVARELRFASWSKLKAHIEALDRQREAIDAASETPDGALKTLHLRCGHDIEPLLVAAGFRGDFLAHPVPYCMGPIDTGPERHARMARFIVDTFPSTEGVRSYEHELAGLVQGEERLEHTAAEYERVVIWAEHDPWDQLFLARVLAHYAQAERPRVLELVAVEEFPGGERFLGLGQLPEEALRLLWSARKPVSSAQLALGHEVWDALASANPTRLAALARSGTPDLPIMAPALQRQLRELPSVENGLSLTERLILEIVAEKTSTTLNDVYLELLRHREPLRWIGDLGTLHVVDAMLAVEESVLVRTPAAPGERDFRQRLTITDTGKAVLRAERDWHELDPPPRWVGGVHVTPRRDGWRWNEALGQPQRLPDSGR